MKSTLSLTDGFAKRTNRMLRPRIVEALDNLGQLNAWELAGMVYGPRRAMRRGQSRACTNSQLVATRRALRRLRAKGVVVAGGRRRRRKVYQLRRDAELLAAVTLGEV
jgi:Fic family protein